MQRRLHRTRAYEYTVASGAHIVPQKNGTGTWHDYLVFGVEVVVRDEEVEFLVARVVVVSIGRHGIE